MRIEATQVADGGCQITPPMDPRVRRTRKLLEDAFRVLVKQKSFAALSVQDITDYATVNRATFYAHYTDKQDLAASVLRNDLRHNLLAQFHERPAFTPHNLVLIAVGVFDFIDALLSDCPETASELAGSVGNTLQEEIYQVIEHWLLISKAHLRLFPDCSKEMVATVISWSIYGGALRWNHTPNRPPAEEACREIVAILFAPSR
ncbi:TetR/AcrR family transcriptional regulator [bacterium]|nr:MAG: TetR/AcrR family transcriptional regulator [bacterium]